MSKFNEHTLSPSQSNTGFAPDQNLISDFKHLGLAVAVDEDPTQPRKQAASAAAQSASRLNNASAIPDSTQSSIPTRPAAPDNAPPRQRMASVDEQTAQSRQHAAAAAAKTAQSRLSPASTNSDTAQSRQHTTSTAIPDTAQPDTYSTPATVQNGQSRSHAASAAAQTAQSKSHIGPAASHAVLTGHEAEHGRNDDKSLHRKPVGSQPTIMKYRTASTDVTVKTAPAVTHETIHRENQEIRQEVITRDIHEYHQVTRILPVVEKEVLPARHFAQTADGRKVEIPESVGKRLAAGDFDAAIPYTNELPIAERLQSEEALWTREYTVIDEDPFPDAV